MSMHVRPLDRARDAEALAVIGDRSGRNLPHVADWPYRFSSWGLDDARNGCVWTAPGGALLGGAVFQTPFWAIDLFLSPDAPSELFETMLRWVKDRAAEGAGRPLWFTSIDARQMQRRRELEAAGFVDVSEADVDPWSKLLFECDDEIDLRGAALPPGWVIRPIDVERELPAYVDMHREVFGSANMTLDWRRTATRMPAYRNDLDLVLVDDAGVFEGFCIGWLRDAATVERVGQIEPLGMRDGARGRGCARLLVAEAVRRMRRLGAVRVCIEADASSPGAATYAALGFRCAAEIRVLRLPKRAILAPFGGEDGAFCGSTTQS